MINTTRLLIFPIAVFFFSSALAQQHDCREPESTTLPVAILSNSQEAQLGAQHKNFMMASARYLGCLQSFAESNTDTLTDADLAALEARRDAYAARLAAHVERWNTLHEAYLRKNP